MLGFKRSAAAQRALKNTKNNCCFFSICGKKRNDPATGDRRGKITTERKPQFGPMFARSQSAGSACDWRHENKSEPKRLKNGSSLNKSAGECGTRCCGLPFTGISGGASSWFSLPLLFLYFLSFLGRAGDMLTKLVTVSPELNPEQIITGSVVQLAACLFFLFVSNIQWEFTSYLFCGLLTRW